MGMMTGKQGVILGIANENSIASHVAKCLANEGAKLALSHLPDVDDRKRMEGRLRNVAQNLEGVEFIHPIDVGSEESIDSFFSELKSKWNKIDFIVHSIAFADTKDIKGSTADVSRSGFLKAMEISAFSLLAISKAALPLFPVGGGSIVAMTYLGGERVVPGYNLMGVCKAALDSCVKYLAYDLGPKQIRVNAVSAGPVRTLAASAVGDFKKMMSLYEQNAPLKRNITAEEVGKSSLYLLSDLSTGVTGEILHVDSGLHSLGLFSTASLES